MIHARSFRPLTLTLLLAISVAGAAQAADVTLAATVQAALASGADVRTAQANFDKAAATQKAREGDPSALVTDLTSARQATDLARVQLASARIGTLQDAIGAYVTLLNAQQTVDLQTLQVTYDTRNLQVAQVKRAVNNATDLDVKNAQAALSSSTQDLADARAQVNLAASSLANLTGLSSSARAATLPSVPALKTSLQALTTGLDTRLPNVVSAAQAVALSQLKVKLSDNDFTPARTLQDARTALANDQRSLDNATRTARATLQDAYQKANTAVAQLQIATTREANAKTSYTQGQTRLKSGLISNVEALKTQLDLKTAQVARVKAQGSVLTALAALSAASGTNVTGIGGV
ncbi:TolC family protein [Deinococcus maricopensis]|uniref:Outer membrane efflux protein n=1 Tax=Deinococcus maricopensis (strain DSM 21211 / LMG 22137 / NRRL B-23946 / LB-34) TaxID=709986 RepID=E8U664_DEIML|nr:TolC family protein [Deinococcus maricopensis]ADV66553.1 outer membrane efflux protein [Deinococcus maricopensis DSM 21211]